MSHTVKVTPCSPGFSLELKWHSNYSNSLSFWMPLACYAKTSERGLWGFYEFSEFLSVGRGQKPFISRLDCCCVMQTALFIRLMLLRGSMPVSDWICFTQMNLTTAFPARPASFLCAIKLIGWPALIDWFDWSPLTGAWKDVTQWRGRFIIKWWHYSSFIALIV